METKAPNTGTDFEHVATSASIPRTLFDVLVGQAKRDERLIQQLAAAVAAADKDRVFTLAKELVRQ